MCQMTPQEEMEGDQCASDDNRRKHCVEVIHPHADWSRQCVVSEGAMYFGQNINNEMNTRDDIFCKTVSGSFSHTTTDTVSSDSEDVCKSKRPRLTVDNNVNTDKPCEKTNETHQFNIIDEVMEDEKIDAEEECASDDSLEDSELHELLEKGITKDSIAQMSEPIEREKVVLVERGHDPFDILPEGWIILTHNSGMPLYLHRHSRVCTLAQPYFLGSGSARKHDIPISAIPCLKYRRELEKEKKCCKGVKVTSLNVHNNDNLSSQDKHCCSVNGNFSEPKECIAANPMLDSKLGGLPDEANILQEGNISNPSNAHTSSSSGVCLTESGVENKSVNSTPEHIFYSPSDSLTVSSCTKNNVRYTASEAYNEKHADIFCGFPESNSVPHSNFLPSSNNGIASCQIYSSPSFPAVTIKSIDEVKKETSIDYLQLRDYCISLFEFKTVIVQRYKTWRERRKHTFARKQSRPELPPNTKLITCSLPVSLNSVNVNQKSKGKEFFLNPSGKSSVCILHEYVQHTMKVQPVYMFRELEKSALPYSATVVINNMEYGRGCANSKKQAKSEAAKKTLKILIPEIKSMTDEQLHKCTDDLSFFDDISIEDPRINELGNKVGQPSPYQILRECLNRNYGMGDTDCVLNMKPLKHQNCEFTITVGKHTATVIAKSKRIGKQQAAQAILQKLHPHVPSWGSLLRLYATPGQYENARMQQERNIASQHHSNQKILHRLRCEMIQLSVQRKSTRSHGLMMVNSEELPNKISTVDL